MKARFGITIMTIVLAACTTSGSNYGRPKVITPQTFACSNGQHAKVKVYSPAEAVMGFSGKQYEMKRVETASGAKYTGGGAEFWSKGISAMITTEDSGLVTCNAVPADATGEEDLTLPGDAMLPYPAASVEKVSIDTEAADDAAYADPGAAPTAPSGALAPLVATPPTKPVVTPAPALAAPVPTPAAKPRVITTAN